MYILSDEIQLLTSGVRIEVLSGGSERYPFCSVVR
jgi:hypothetical protein